jgi:hypothetical protein
MKNTPLKPFEVAEFIPDPASLKSARSLDRTIEAFEMLYMENCVKLSDGKPLSDSENTKIIKLRMKRLKK